MVTIETLGEPSIKKTAYFMTSGKLDFWPTYPTLIEMYENYDNLIVIFDLPP